MLAHVSRNYFQKSHKIEYFAIDSSREKEEEGSQEPSYELQFKTFF